MKQKDIRAERDKALKTAFARMGPEGYTALDIQRLAGGRVHRETLRAILEDLVHARVLLVERRPRDNRYRPAPNWVEEFEGYVRARDARLAGRAVPEPEDDAEPAPGIPLVLHAMRSQPTSVWALASHA